MELVLAEIEAAPPQPGQRPLATVFFGGGTPSLIPAPLLARLLDALHAKFGFAVGAEISMEADPGTASHHALDCHIWTKPSCKSVPFPTAKVVCCEP